MLVSEAIQAVQSLYSRGVQSQDSRLMPKHIWNKLLRARSSILIQMLNKKQFLSQFIYQTIPCVELIQSNAYECPCVVPAGCMLLRSKFPIPKPVANIGQHAIQSVTSLDGSLVIDGVDFATNKYTPGNKYTSKKPQWFIYNNYLYVTIIKYLKVVQITMIADNPEEVWAYPSFCDAECTDCCLSPLDREFPADQNVTDTVIQMASNELVNLFTQMRQDKWNNADDDTLNANIVHQPQQPLPGQ
jgi:hypothetical protein